MKRVVDFKAEAREALAGKWPAAVLTGFLAGLIGTADMSDVFTTSISREDLAFWVEAIQDAQRSALWPFYLTIVAVTLGIAVLLLVLYITFGGAASLGHAKFNLKLVDGEPVAVLDLFSQFHRLWRGFCMNFLMGLYITLWKLLLLIPGIIKSYSYAMTPYILAENPEMTVTEGINESRRIMHGNKWCLFCLDLSFIGWDLLCWAPLFIAVAVLEAIAAATWSPAIRLLLCPLVPFLLVGWLFLRPYREAAFAAFYRDVSGTAVVPAPALPEESLGE